MGLERFVLVGHSFGEITRRDCAGVESNSSTTIVFPSHQRALGPQDPSGIAGGYLSAKYALRHPERVEHVVLVGPAGVPSKPQDWTPERFRERMGIKPYSIR